MRGLRGRRKERCERDGSEGAAGPCNDRAPARRSRIGGTAVSLAVAALLDLETSGASGDHGMCIGVVPEAVRTKAEKMTRDGAKEDFAGREGLP